MLSAEHSVAQRQATGNSGLQQFALREIANAGKVSLQAPLRRAQWREIISAARGGDNSEHICNDTSGSFYFRKDSFSFYVGEVIVSSDRDLVMSGQSTEIHSNGGLYSYIDKGFLMKCDTAGVIKWIRTYDSIGAGVNSFINYRHLTELKDGSYLMAGYTYNLNTTNADLIFTRTDKSGDIIWSTVLKSRFWVNGSGSADYYDLQNVIQDKEGDGDLYFSGSYWTAGKNVTRMNLNNGDIVWSRSYDPAGSFLFDRAIGLDIKGNELLAFGTVLDGSGNSLLTAMRINKNDGDTIQYRTFTADHPMGVHLGLLMPGQLVKLNNGNYAVYGGLYGARYPSFGEPFYQAGVVIIDPQLNIVNAWCFRSNVDIGGAYLDVQMFPDGTGVLAFQRYVYGISSDIFTVQFRGSAILKQRRKRYEGIGIGDRMNIVELLDGSHLIQRQLTDTNRFEKGRLEFLRLHTTDTSSVCLGVNEFSTFTEPFNLKELPGKIVRIEKDDLGAGVNKMLRVRTDDLESISGCLQVSRCDSLGLTASADTVCKGTDLILTVHKNRECGASPFFEYDAAAVRKFIQLSDTTWQIGFQNSWKGKIYAHMSGCASYTDSVELVVLSTPDALNLGADTAICPGNQVLLQAPEGFASYRWQDGSADSFFKAEAPGTYHVVADNGCGTLYRDTVVIAARASAPLHLGADQEICRYDSVRLSAPADFLTYSWSPAYQVSDVAAAQVVVKPEKDTAYILKAEKPEGCFSFDTVYIKVKPVPKVTVGADTALCAGDSLALDPGAGFASYLWNTGATSQKLNIRTVGNYSVTATAVNGCVAADTMAITSVFALPVVELGNDSVICQGTPLELHAGRFSAYKWSTGANTEAITINSKGLYAVQVTDVNGCLGVDTLIISREVVPPVGFLPADTAICSYQTYRLSASRPYASYRWSTGAGSPAVDLTNAGAYWLQVSDQYGCKGTDTIHIALKSCMEGFYIPSAFTPDNDGKNDAFRPLIFGNIVQYRFTVYNRWGQVVFNSNEPGKGWDGGIKGQRQDMQVFVWICSYQLRGSGMVQKKGTVTIVR